MKLNFWLVRRVIPRSSDGRNICEVCSPWAGWRDSPCNYGVLQSARHLWYLRKTALTVIRTRHPDSISWTVVQWALTMTSDLTRVWGDQNSGIYLKPGRWSRIPFAKLSEGSASFCIPRQGLYLANNLHLDSVVLLVGLSEKSYILSCARCSQDVV